MKILAVIPAKRKSESIPNKNIRIINGHPMVYYTIKNACQSKLITDVVVTTDSPEIKSIAEHMGVSVLVRDEVLCRDEITLDRVVYDAIPKETKWDYIITLEPTAPTLKCDTLDMAIQYCIDENLETVISVKNSPKLTWRRENGVCIPNYSERINSQYMQPCYTETGAFIISRADVVSQKSRCGKKVDVYEIDEREAVEVKRIEDLILAEAYLKPDRVAFYVNGNNMRGTGHVYRVLELADEFRVKPDIYYDINQTDVTVFGDTMHRLIPVDGIVDLFDKCRENNYSIFINDILTTSLDYMIGLKSVNPCAKIVNFEDDGEGAREADIVFNALYEGSELKNVYSGYKYYIASKSFMFYEPIKIKENVKKVLITFGGADPQNYTDRVLKIIESSDYGDYQFVVVLGRSKNNIDALMEYNKYNNIDVLYNVNNMAEIMSSCDIAITSRGRTSYELALLGIPSIVLAQNEREEKHSFISNENGFAYIGLNPADEIIKGQMEIYLKTTEKTRLEIQRKLLHHDLRNGRNRVMGMINVL